MSDFGIACDHAARRERLARKRLARWYHSTGQTQYCVCDECEADRLIEAHQEDREDWSSRLYRGNR